jgi:hypothetical protein
MSNHFYLKRNTQLSFTTHFIVLRFLHLLRPKTERRSES